MTDLGQLRAYRHAEFLEQLASGRHGLMWCRSYSTWMDNLIRRIFDATSRGTSPHGICILATGGYGRRELAPWSDVDLALVVREESLALNDRLVRETYTQLFDTIQAGLLIPLGYAYHLVGDTSALDGKSRTGLLDARLVAGDPNVMREFQTELDATFAPGSFLIEKLAERAESLQRTHDTPLVVEPNLKDGCGGLRDFHCANWIRHAIGMQPLQPSQAYETVVMFRNALHGVAGKAVERLSRAKQAEIAEVYGSDPFAMGDELASSMIELQRKFQESVDLLQEVRFEVSPGVLALRGEARLVGGSRLSDLATGLAQATKLGLRIVPQPVSMPDTLADPSILDALRSGEPAVRSLDQSGLLAAMLPELTRCRTLLPRDSTHEFSVFEHTLRVVRFLDDASMPGWLAEVRTSFDHWELLVLAALLHDVGKIDTTKPHSETGAVMAREAVDRWRLARSDADLVVWLVEHHLALDRTIRFRDVYDPIEAKEFADFVGNRARLDALSLLTWADVHAVSAQSWTPSQDEALRVLYHAVMVHLEQPLLSVPDSVKLRRKLSAELSREVVDEGALHHFVESLSTAYVVATSPDMVRLHFHYFQKALAGETTLEFNHRPDLRLTELTVCTPDQPGLLSLLMGALYALDLGLQSVRVHTTQTQPAVALDQFTVDYANGVLPEATCQLVSQSILDVLDHSLPLSDLFASTGKDFAREQENVNFHFVDSAGSILEIRAPRGRGLGFRMARWIASQDWNITDARFGQWAGRGAATFRIERPDRTPVSRGEVEVAIAARV